ncbi:MAG: redoxin domain-containing protein [Bacteroidetes bacterium]|nr:redoxin domain-containing protein [Bacteroidota bacterium]
MKQLNLIILFVLLFKLTGVANLSPTLFDLELSNMSGGSFALSTLAENKASIFVFITPECPIAQRYTLTMRNMAKEYEKNNIKIYGIVSGTYYTVKDMKKFKKKYLIDFPIFFDRSLIVTKTLDAQITPQAFLVDNRGKVLYDGQIDNWYFALGRARQVITEFYLKDAVQSYLANEEIKVKKTRAIGCIIEY